MDLCYLLFKRDHSLCYGKSPIYVMKFSSEQCIAGGIRPCTRNGSFFSVMGIIYNNIYLSIFFSLKPGPLCFAVCSFFKYLSKQLFVCSDTCYSCVTLGSSRKQNVWSHSHTKFLCTTFFFF